MNKYFQAPNLPMIVAVASSALFLIVHGVPFIGILIALIAFGSWFTWAWLELFDGSFLVRRILGGIVMILLFVTAFIVTLSGIA